MSKGRQKHKKKGIPKHERPVNMLPLQHELFSKDGYSKFRSRPAVPKAEEFRGMPGYAEFKGAKLVVRRKHDPALPKKKKSTIYSRDWE